VTLCIESEALQNSRINVLWIGRYILVHGDVRVSLVVLSGSSEYRKTYLDTESLIGRLLSCALHIPVACGSASIVETTYSALKSGRIRSCGVIALWSTEKTNLREADKVRGAPTRRKLIDI
jgi:hypothetical protein